MRYFLSKYILPLNGADPQTILAGTVSTIGLWGHSMGAATALMFAHTDPSIAALVLDCGFAGLFTTRKYFGFVFSGSYNCTPIGCNCDFTCSHWIDLKQVAMEMTKHAEEAGFKVSYAHIPNN